MTTYSGVVSDKRLRQSDFSISEGFDSFMGRHTVRTVRDNGGYRWQLDNAGGEITIFNPSDNYHVSGALLTAYFRHRK